MSEPLPLPLPLPLEEIHHVRVHPAIGVARVGNSPDEFFVGPERIGVVPSPGDGHRYKDAQGRVKRQAARFRCFGFDESGDRWTELTHGDGVLVEWTVHLVNKKACAERAVEDGLWRNKPPGHENEPHDAASREALTVDPGPREIAGENKRGTPATGRVSFGPSLTAEVTLGELRTDEDGRLLVLGGPGGAGSPGGTEVEGFDSDGWWDDVADGPVGARVRLPGREAPLSAQGAWVVVGPPKFTPALDTSVSLWDRLQDLFTAPHELDGFTPSYTRDIQPVLHRARHMNAVFEQASGKHLDWPEPLYGFYHRRKIDSWLERGKGDDSGQELMPLMQTGDDIDVPGLTRRQLFMLAKWREGEFHRDWEERPAEVPLTPETLDRAALQACVGKAFYPGIEVGRWMLKKEHWAQPYRSLRFAEGVEAGDVTARMAVPWQSDFQACDGDWWPVPRPSEVIPEHDERAYRAWTREWVPDAANMTRHWHRLGFVSPDGKGNFRERERATPPHRFLAELGSPASLGEGQWTVPSPQAEHADVWQSAGELSGTDLALYGRGEAAPGSEQRWPLLLTDEDRFLDLTVRAQDAARLAVRLRTPQGNVVPMGRKEISGVLHDDRIALRVALPVEVVPGRPARAGRWEVRVSAPGDADGPVPYQVTVACESPFGTGAARAARGPDGRLVLTVPGLDGDGALGGDGTRGGGSGADGGLEAVLALESGDEVPLRSLAAAGAYEAAEHDGAADARTVRLRLTGRSRLGNPYVRERFVPVESRT